MALVHQDVVYVAHLWADVLRTSWIQRARYSYTMKEKSVKERLVIW